MINPHQLSNYLFRELHRHPGVSFLYHCGFVALFSLYLFPELDKYSFMIWLMIAVSGGVWQWRVSSRMSEKLTDVTKAQNISSFKVASLAAGLSFGLTALLMPELSETTRLFVILMLGTVAASELLKLSAYPPVYGYFLVGLISPLIIVLAVGDHSPGWELIPAVFLMSVVLYHSASQRRQDLMDDLIARFDLEQDAGQDKLTQLANRRRFDLVLGQIMAQAKRDKTPVSLVMLDIDHFKKFNDRYGHQAGDKCLAAVAKVLDEGVHRASDLVARYGGEEFVILLNQTPRDDAYQIVENIRQAVENLNIENQDAEAGIVTISMGGITMFIEEDAVTDHLVKLADMALYRSKASGRNRVSWFNASLDKDI